jgi:GDPmannose 4,6-dehydratase
MNERAPSSARTALVCGVGGQDGAYLAHFLVDRGYRVVGTSRDAASLKSDGLKYLGIDGRVEIVSMAPNDFRSVLQTITRFEPDEIYNLAGQSSVGLSFEQPVETIESIALGTLNFLEAIRFVGRPTALYNAGSSECFGDTGDRPASESTPFRPRSPYAIAKTCAHHLVVNYREAYRLRACTGILFNHESPLRPERFVTQKVVRAACRIAAGSSERVQLGDLSVWRDWGWAPEYVEVMWLMLQQPTLEDFVIATGRTTSLEYFVDRSFASCGLDWREHVDRDASLLRPTDIRFGAGDPSNAAARLNWQATSTVDDVVAKMCDAERRRIASRSPESRVHQHVQ